jgi:hypothetical protein
MVRYYGHYSNVARGIRKKQDENGLIPSDSEPVENLDFSGEGSLEARSGATYIFVDYRLRTLTLFYLAK